MEIKNFLKKYKITLKELADILEISRPTLNTYIYQYEQEEEIQNKLYQNIFKSIFTKEWGDKVEIFEEINHLKRNKNNENVDYLSENLELINSIKEKMYSDMKGAKEVLPLYKFINSVLYNYNGDDGLTGYIDYNLYLNGLKELKNISEEEKILISNIYPIMKNFVKDKLIFDEEGYKLFCQRVEEIKKMRIEETERIEKEFQERIRRELELKFNIGKTIEEKKILELLEKIKF
ncbi:hypothetical protein [Fusobacterium sp.]|uniref:hypothetical protein n=1 Tax=Fusobacterium sp. TaxID=68766 RepID=UPI0025B9F11E|nr:hypothetical protein [Fusobacterium sp.]